MIPHVIVRSALTPLMAQPTLRAEQVSQIVLGETAAVLERAGEWRRVRLASDGYEGWTHRGFSEEVGEQEAEQWQTQAIGWSMGAVVRVGGHLVRLPLRARLALKDGGVQLPDGRMGEVVEGSVPDSATVVAAARAKAPERWAMEHFAGAPYQWGGVTPWGVDCSGLVQTTFSARGLQLPRDSAAQVSCGTPVPLDAARPGDLLFFQGEESRNITHVAFAGEGDTLVHSTVACGGVLVEPWLSGTRTASLRERLVSVRRLEGR
ncbi:MAG: C40 family peptidase [Gemmatimonadales bacterium]|nr:C40 family peptidase [Gemmatimonadales bacterium]